MYEVGMLKVLCCTSRQFGTGVIDRRKSPNRNRGVTGGDVVELFCCTRFMATYYFGTILSAVMPSVTTVSRHHPTGVLVGDRPPIF